MSKIFGIGIDIVENKRIENLIEKFGLKFLLKTFSEKEIELAKQIYCKTAANYNYEELIKNTKNKNLITNYFAKRFAAKEAFVKALGVGFNGKFGKSSIHTLKNDFGTPIIQIDHPDTITYVNGLIKSPYEIFVSLSDEKKFSIAQVIIEKI
jgi:holo-[acyl-carrier protein] synthase